MTPVGSNSRGITGTVHLVWGKVRRLYYTAFGDGYVTQQLSNRKGGCRQCGICGKTLFHSPFLDESAMACRGRIQGRHFSTCRAFPLDELDLPDRDLVSPRVSCGYCLSASDSGEDGSREPASHPNSHEFGDTFPGSWTCR